MASVCENNFSKWQMAYTQYYFCSVQKTKQAHKLTIYVYYVNSMIYLFYREIENIFCN